MWLYLLGVVCTYISRSTVWGTFILPVDILMGRWLRTLHWTFSASLQRRRFMADNLLPCSRVGPQQHRPQTSAASSEHCTPKHSSFQPGDSSSACTVSPAPGMDFPDYTDSFVCLHPGPPTPWTPPLAMAFHLQIKFPVSRQASCTYTRTK